KENTKMFPFTKAKPKKNEHAERLLDAAEGAVYRAFRHFIQSARNIEIEELLASGGIDAVLNSLDIHIARFAANWSNVFIEIANREAKSLELSKAKKKPTVAGIFDPGDPASADLMRRASLNLINNLTNEQRRVIRNALAQGLREGLSTEDLARRIRDNIGLSEQQQRQLDIFANAQRRARNEAMLAG